VGWRSAVNYRSLPRDGITRPPVPTSARRHSCHSANTSRASLPCFIFHKPAMPTLHNNTSQSQRHEGYIAGPQYNGEVAGRQHRVGIDATVSVPAMTRGSMRGQADDSQRAPLLSVSRSHQPSSRRASRCTSSWRGAWQRDLQPLHASSVRKGMHGEYRWIVYPSIFFPQQQVLYEPAIRAYSRVSKIHVTRVCHYKYINTVESSVIIASPRIKCH
jgi:hypothetical protein